jgi:hypothetical protein
MTDINMDPINEGNIVLTNEKKCDDKKINGEKSLVYQESRVMNKGVKNVIHSKKKVSDEEFRVVRMNEYELVKRNKYKITQLKEMCKFYKLKRSGNKDELKVRIYDFLRYSLYVIKIQKVVKGNLVRKYIESCGPALKKRSLCMNDSDFASLEPVEEIPHNQFFSFTDENNNIYGCDIVSLYGLLDIKKKTYTGKCSIPLNPYTRAEISEELRRKFSLRLRLARVNRIEHIVVDVIDTPDPAKQLEFKILELFQYINELGNYADSRWFTNLSKNMTIIFIKEMYDIWGYRAQLSPTVMREIVPPHGNPFIGMSLHQAQHQSEEHVKRIAIRIIEMLTMSGHVESTRSLGAYYVLSALTLVSEEARIALPWLYESVAH